MNWSKYPAFDTSRVTLHPHDDIVTKLHVDDLRALKQDVCELADEGSATQQALTGVVRALQHAKEDGKPRMLFMGAHPIKLGLSRYLCNLIAHGWFTHVATTGAGLIHDWQLTHCDCTDEDVPATLAKGQFGFWDHFDQLNKMVNAAALSGAGLGEYVGGVVYSSGTPVGTDKPLPTLINGKKWQDVYQYSIAGMCWKRDVPFTVHATIGTDIVAMYPSYSGEAWGKASYQDFRIFTEAVTKSDGGVFINVGSAVTGPEVFLKAMSVAANVGKMPNLTTAVFDRYPLPDDWVDCKYGRNDTAYYWRPLKTILQRTVAANPSAAHYVRGDFKWTIPRLWTQLRS